MGDVTDMNVVIINGVAESGKDTFVEYVSEVWEGKDLGCVVVNHSTIDSVKEFCQVLGCKIREKSQEARVLWSSVKDAWTKYNNGPAVEAIKKIVDYHRDFPHSDTLVFFLHCREPEEIKKIRGCLALIPSIKVTTLLVNRPDILAKSNKCVKDNFAAVTSGIDYDVIIINESLDGLRKSAENFVSNLAK